MTLVTAQTSTTNPKNDANSTALHKSQNAVVLLSGGLDSVTCLYWAKTRYASVTAVSFNYGQRHNSELSAAKAIAESAGVNHRIIDIDIAQLGGSSLTDHSMIIPDGDTDKFPSKNRDEVDNDAIPNTYVPARNTIFLSYALTVAEVTDANHIVIGVSSVDYSGYPDCRPEYITAFEHMANTAAAFNQSKNYRARFIARGRLWADDFLLSGRYRWSCLQCLRQLCATWPRICSSWGY